MSEKKKITIHQDGQREHTEDTITKVKVERLSMIDRRKIHDKVVSLTNL